MKLSGYYTYTPNLMNVKLCLMLANRDRAPSEGTLISVPRTDRREDDIQTVAAHATHTQGYEHVSQHIYQIIYTYIYRSEETLISVPGTSHLISFHTHFDGERHQALIHPLQRNLKCNVWWERVEVRLC